MKKVFAVKKFAIKVLPLIASDEVRIASERIPNNLAKPYSGLLDGSFSKTAWPAIKTSFYGKSSASRFLSQNSIKQGVDFSAACLLASLAVDKSNISIMPQENLRLRNVI